MERKERDILQISLVMLYLLWPNFGHMTDTGECEGQIGCLAPEVRQREQPPPNLTPPSLEKTQAPCV